MKASARPFVAILLLVATAITSCSGGSSGDGVAPTIVGGTQNRSVDPLGLTVDVEVSERVKAGAANLASTWTVSSGTVTAAVLQPDQKTVRLTLDSVAVPGDVTFGAVAPAAAAGSVTLSAQVTDGDTITIGDGISSYTFEFTSGGAPSPGNWGVNKGASATTAIANFIARVNAVAPRITASAGAGDSANLVNDVTGIDGNVALAKTDVGSVITLVGLAGGAGLEDLAGNKLAAAAGLAIASMDLVQPTASTLAALTVEGADNDTLTVLFDDDMIESEVETPANWTVETPVGTAFDMTGSTIDYVPATRTATVTLGAGTVGSMADANNVQTFDDAAAAFTVMRDVAGNLITPTTIGVDAVSGLAVGDDRAPSQLVAWADGAATTAAVRFSEPCKIVSFVDLYAGGTDPGPRLLLTDADATPAVAATGTVTLSALPADGDTVTIDDGAVVVTFEYDSDMSVMNTPTLRQVVVGVDADATTANFATAVNDPGFMFAITGSAAMSVCNLTHDTPGATGNIAITKIGANVSVSGMSGGANAVAGVVNPVSALYSWSADGLGVMVDYAATVPVPAADSLEVYGIQDLAGNQIFAQPSMALVAEDTNPPAIVPGSSSLTVVAGELNDTIVVEFDRAMNPFNVLEPANYSAAPLDLSNATFAFDGTDTLTITLDGSPGTDVQFGAMYNLTLVQNAGTPLMTAQGVALPGDDVETLAAVGDNSAITQPATSAYPGDGGNPSTCVVDFPEAVDAAAATTLTNYDIGAVNPTAAVMMTPRAVRLTFAAAPMATDTLNVAVAAATDLGGTPAAAPLAVVLGAADATAPTATVTANAVPNMGGDTIVLTYSEPVDQTTALDVSNYVVTEGGSPVSLTGASLTYDSASTSVTIALAGSVELTLGASVDVAISNVEDLSAIVLAVQPTAVNVAGDGTPPGFGPPESAFVNWIVDNGGTTVDALFSEDVDETFVENAGNWSASGPTVILSVQRTAPDIARVVTAAQIGAGETLQLTGLPDLAGNVSGAINVNPNE